MTKFNVAVALSFGFAESTTLKVTEYEPFLVGVPLILPPLPSVKPGGSVLPVLRLQV